MEPEWPVGLTAKQAVVASMIARGASRAQVAEAIGCSVRTADSHRAVVLGKLKARNAVHLARMAIRLGLVSGGEDADIAGDGE